MTTTTASPSSVAQPKVNALTAGLALGLVLLISAVAFGTNLFGFPLYSGDEGLILGRAYAVLEQGWLTPYTYWYDHAPAGWLLLAVWVTLTGGFDAFGTAINSGRVLMLFLHLATTALIFWVVFRQYADHLAASAAALFYALSPLLLLHGRTVRLDNMMVFWAMLATALLLTYSSKLWPIIWSGFFLGLAALTKESALLLIPAFVFGLWTTMRRSHARFARAGWLFAALATISLYPLYASLREELFTFDLSSPLSGQGGDVSLLGSALWQLSQSGGLPWHSSSDFYQALTNNWLAHDPWLLGLGLVALLWNLATGDPRRRTAALLAVMALLTLAHGNQVFEFYIVGLLPFLALNTGLALADIARRTAGSMLSAGAVVGVVALGWLNLGQAQQPLFDLDINYLQRDAVTWLRKHVTPNAQIVVDDALWVDLRYGEGRHPGFPGTHSHWQTAMDPAVHHDLFHDDYRFIDYLVTSPEMTEAFAAYPDRLPQQAFENSTPVANFSFGEAAVEIRRVNHPGLNTREMLIYSYDSFLERYLHNGQIRLEGDYADARDQASALLMAVWMDDRQTFDELWSWASLHLQSEDGLLLTTNEPGVDAQIATEAQIDAAMALILAHKQWADEGYARQAERLVGTIWEELVVKVEGKPYLIAGDWAISRRELTLAPATFSPYAYHFFADIDDGHAWWYLLDSSYELLADISAQSEVGLPPSLVTIDRRSGRLSVPSEAQFDPQTAQLFWRVGLDALWHDDPRADEFLASSHILETEFEVKGELATAYSLKGRATTAEESLLLYSAILPKFLVQDPALAHRLFATKLATTYQQDGCSAAHWADTASLTDQRWAWLASALYADLTRYTDLTDQQQLLSHLRSDIQMGCFGN